MTSAEFVAKYKLFKPIAERGARSFLAQEVQGHRAVLVHRLDIAPPDENRRMLISIDALRPEERSSIIEVTDVDGVAVVVTRFTPDFHDLPSWLAQRETAPFGQARVDSRPSPAPAPGGFTSAFSGYAADVPPPFSPNRSTPQPGGSPDALTPAQVAPPSTPFPPAPPAAAPAGEFTQLFGTPLGRSPADAPLAARQPAPAQAPTQQPAAPVAPRPTTPAPGEFTQLFQGMSAAPAAADPARDSGPRSPVVQPPASSSWPPSPPVAPPPPWVSAPPAQPAIPPTTPPAFAAPAIPPSAPHHPPPARAAAPGEFTQLFQGFGTPSSAPAAPPFPAVPAPVTPPVPQISSPGGLPPLSPPAFGSDSIMGPPVPPAASFGGPPAPSFAGAQGAQPSFGGSLGGPPPLSPSQDAPPAFNGGLFAPSAPPPPPVAAAGFPPSTLPGTSPVGSSPAGASEFTRMLGAIAPPKAPAAPPPLPVAPAPQPPATAAAQSAGSIKSYLPLILGLNVVLIAATGVILYFLLK